MTDTDAGKPSRRNFLVAGVAGGAAAAATTLPTAAFPITAQPDTIDDTEARITESTLAEAEKLAAVEFTPSERKQILTDIGDQIQRHIGRRSVEFPNTLAPSTVFDPRVGDMTVSIVDRFVRSKPHSRPLPPDDESIAFEPVTALSTWIQRGLLTSERLTRIYLRRLERIGPKLECTITLLGRRAIAQARRADAEIRDGGYRGPLHGIPWGAKDLFDTRGIRTTWGATPFTDRVPVRDATVVSRLNEAGAILIAKLTLGALAYGDIWYGGRTNNPWKLDQGSSGSSAGSCAATAAGLTGFALGTETLGSIVSPSMRCGTTGLRPTFGRVARTGAMALCWSLDKVGPICRTVQDTALVLGAINGADPGDPSSIDMPLEFDGDRAVRGLRVGYCPKWFEDGSGTDLDRAALTAMRRTGVKLVEFELPDLPYATLLTILLVEAASAFDELTLSDRDDELVWQEPRAWPNSFRTTRFIPAVEYVQAQRFRRVVCEMMTEQFDGLDAMIGPSYAGSMLLITNCTGHPSLTIRCGFADDGTPHGITLWGGMFREGTLCSIGMALERELGVWDRRPGLL
jgi:Asp-tRNA(Asn)/Glu-tRNA(Gln) amidotransferase A subunit family amidase